MLCFCSAGPQKDAVQTVQRSAGRLSEPKDHSGGDKANHNGKGHGQGVALAEQCGVDLSHAGHTDHSAQEGRDAAGQAFPYTGKMFDLSRGASYTMFLGGDQPYIEINTNGATKKTLLMLKDSYSNALIPWLASSYSKIIVIDARTFDQTITKILNTTPIDDFLITNYILGTNFRDYIKMCRDIY